MSRRASSYDPGAQIPATGSRWVWEIDKPHAIAVIEVTDAQWSGEEWWVRTKTLLRNPTYPGDMGTGEYWNDLSRFWEAVTPVGMTVGVKPGIS